MTDMPPEIQQAIDEINALTPRAKEPKEQFPFESLAQQTAAATIESAEQALNKAQSFLEETKREAEAYLQQIKARADKLRDQIGRQEKLANTVLDGHKEFHNGG